MYKVLKQEGRAKRAEVTTVHGTIQTPVFMNVGTVAAIKGAVSTADLEEIGTQVELSNTYHLHVRTGDKVIKQLGGLHKFMSWDKPILTDSGGFQVFSLAHLNNITEDGVKFKDPKTGDEYYINPEISMEIQQDLGPDIAMAFDQCAPYPCTHEEAVKAMDRTHRWLERCFKAHTREDQALFPICQGAFFDDLREKCAQEVSQYDAVGYAMGGVSVGEPTELKNHLVELTAPLLPHNKPRYLMGVGTPIDLLEGVKRGVDMFDCVLPTRNARHGSFFTYEGKKNIKNKQFERDASPLDEKCDCYACQNHSKAYIRHLYRMGEANAQILLSIHNTRFLLKFIHDMRNSILEDRFEEFYNQFAGKI